jgi:hypothetical protein
MDGTALRERVRKLREEIAEIRKHDEEYLQVHHHTRVEIKLHIERNHRMEEIVRELVELMKRRTVQ